MTRLRQLLAVAIVGTAAHAAATSLFRRQRHRHARGRRHILVTQGGAQLALSADEIADAVVSVLMGGVVLDLRACAATGRPGHLDILAVMGGVRLVVPAGWNVVVQVDPTMGGIHDGRPAAAAERPPDLVVTGQVVMGGLEISTDLPRGLASTTRRAAS